MTNEENAPNKHQIALDHIYAVTDRWMTVANFLDRLTVTDNATRWISLTLTECRNELYATASAIEREEPV